MFDFQNDGNKDIFVANGIYQDLTDQDFLQYVTQDEVIQQIASPGSVDFQKLIDLIPSVPISNYAFINNGNLDFNDMTSDLGLGQPSFSNGSAYGDLDNDGDYDLVVNNVNMESFVYRNNTDKLYPLNNYLKIKLIGDKNNPNGVGSSITLFVGDKKYYLEQMPIRGFQSTVDNNLIFGVGESDIIDSLVVRWDDGKITKKDFIDVNQFVTIKKEEFSEFSLIEEFETKIFTQMDDQILDFVHKENNFVDFDRDRLLFHMSSSEGSCICEGDINGDGYKDLYIGGSKGYSGSIYIWNDNKFEKYNYPLINSDKESEDTDCIFFDANQDGSLDLYVASGGNEYSIYSPELRDRLYYNVNNNYVKSDQILPSGLFESSSVVKNYDFDLDGDEDLFVGTRLIPQKYGLPSNGYLLENDGLGNFKNVSDVIAKDLKEVGMITDADFFDYDSDGDFDLILVGHWMPITLLENRDGKFYFKNIDAFENSNGWWNSIEVNDLNNDGLLDLVIGNHGENSRFRATKSKPITMYINDFDDNNSLEQVIFQYNGDSSYTMALRHDLVMQMPGLKKKYLKYNSYKNQTVHDIFNLEKIKSSYINYIYNLKTSAFINNGAGFSNLELPVETQFSNVFAIEINDYNNDGYNDIILGGNLYNVKPEVGRYDANYGQILLGNNKLDYKVAPYKKSGLLFKGQVRDFSTFKNLKGDNYLIVLNNSDSLQSYTF